VTDGYWEEEQRTRAAFLDGGWFYTGDHGHSDADGYLYLDAREQELINVGGRKVAPVEVETRLLAHGGIEHCACIGVPDPDGITGETVWAYLVSRSGFDEAQLVEWLRQDLEPYKIPTKFVYVESIPTTESGKLQRLELKRKALQQIGGPENSGRNEA
jgi:long-chain acyl-CoA synthetase